MNVFLVIQGAHCYEGPQAAITTTSSRHASSMISKPKALPNSESGSLTSP